MPETLYRQLEKLRDNSIDLSFKNRLLHFQSKARFQSPLLSENSIIFYDKWATKSICIPLATFAPISTEFTDQDQQEFLADFQTGIRDTVNSEGEQNVFMAMGFLRWFDENGSSPKTPRMSPVLLVPVHIDPETLAVSASNAPVIENVPLRLQCKGMVALPKAQEAYENGSFQIETYFSLFDKAIAAHPQWKMTNKGICLAFFNSSKLYNFLDLEAEFWKDKKTLLSHPVISKMLSTEGFRVLASAFDEKRFDEVFHPADYHFLYPLDSGATLAVLEALQPENEIFAIHTPPGSNKNETVANLVAENIAQGKKVLLTYRKQASLERFQSRWAPPFMSFKELSYADAQAALRQSRDEIATYYKAVNVPIPPGNQALANTLIAIADNSPYKKTIPDSAFQGAEKLNVEEFQEACGLVHDFAELIGKPEVQEGKKYFANSYLTYLTEIQKGKIRQMIDLANDSFQILEKLANAIAKTYFFNRDIDLEALEEVSNAITPEFGPNTPSFEKWNLQSKDWYTYEDNLKALPEAGNAWSDYRRQGSSLFTDNAIEENIIDARDKIADNIDKTFKAFSEYYREAQKTLLKTIKNPKLVTDDRHLLSLINPLIELQEHKKLYKNTSALANHLCGKDWKFEKTNWTNLSTKIHWLYAFRKKNQAKSNAALSFALLENYYQLQPVIPDAQTLKNLCVSSKDLFNQLQEALGLPPSTESLSIATQMAKIKEWAEGFSFLSFFVQSQEKSSALKHFGLESLVEYAENEPSTYEDIELGFTHYWYGIQVQNICKVSPTLFSISPKDRAKQSKLYRSVMNDFCNANFKFVQETLENKKATFVQAPLSEISKNLPPQLGLFDLVIFLDSETIPPSEALPAILRAKRTILVGDSFLPSGQFWLDRVKPEKEHFILPHLENIMSFALHKGAGHALLSLNQDHQHQALVEFANQEIYDNKIKALPQTSSSPFRDMLLKVTDDPVTAIAEAAIHHAEKHSSHSLGILAFTVSRCEAIREALALQIQKHPEVQSFFNPKNIIRDFYIKLPEEAVGDFRDTLLICAEMSTSIAQPGLGSKVVNLCATHALRKLRIYTSEPLQESSPSSNPGIQMYWKWLQFVKNITQKRIFSDNSLISPFIEKVIKALNGNNLSIETNWGYHGANISLAIRDANNPEQFLLAIEDDSDSGFLRESVEDREYMRPAMLNRLGWKTVRIWCPLWFKSPADERDHILTTIAVEQSVAAPPQEKEPEAEEEDLSAALHVEPYRILHPHIEASAHDKPIPELEIKHLILQMKFYVDREGPIHEECLLRRLLELHRVERAGPGVTQALEAALSQGIQRKAFIKTGHFFYSVNLLPLVLRNRENLPKEERLLAYVSPEERALFLPNTDETTIKQVLGLL